MASCDSKTYTNIRDLPQAFNITSGDYLIVENPQGTSIIDFKDVILPIEQTTYASNLSALEVNVAALSAELKIVSNAALPSIMNVRMSLSPTTPTPTTSLSGNNASTLYVHPFKGDTVTLYDTALSAWKAYTYNTVVGTSLVNICNTANTCYDIYLGIRGGAFEITSRPWVNSNPQDINFNAATETQYLDGIPLHPTDRSRRLIGSIRTVAAGQSEVSLGTVSRLGGSHPKVFLWNQYNREPLTFSILETGVLSNGINRWTCSTRTGGTNGPLGMFGGNNNRLSFITREKNTIGMNSIMYTTNDNCWYFGYSLDLETPTCAELRQKLPGIPIAETCVAGSAINSFNATINSGFHYIQLVAMVYASTDYNPVRANPDQTFLVWTGDGDRHSYGTTGVLFGY
jgi:hypothetical protein